MTVVPLPDTPCLRVRLVYSDGGALEAGNRFYLSYSGSAPTGANCVTIAGDIEGYWTSYIAPLVNTGVTLTEIDVLDIATNSGLSGQWTGSSAGVRAGTGLPLQVATNVELDIARRYRGGKPRLYLPPGCESDLATQASYTSGFLASVNSDVAGFFSHIAGISVGSVGTLAHVNLSYYKGFTNITNSSGRERAVPTYRATALHDVITGYSAKATLGSQRRRRTSTTP
jgi:hypothetical protein